MKSLVWLITSLVLGFGCSKKSPEAPAATVPERLEISPSAASVKTFETVSFALKYFNTQGKEAPLPAGIAWTSSNTAIATVDQQGNAKGVAPGQVDIVAKLNMAEAKGLLTVVISSNDIATITIEPIIKELLLNETSTLSAVARNINNEVLTGKTFTWQSANINTVDINASSGQVTGKMWGTALVTAMTEGKSSAPAMVQVIRRGSFSGQNSMGTAKLKIENGVLKLQTSSDFSVSSGAPDLRMYLSSNSGNVNNAIEISSLMPRSGAYSWNIPAGVSIGQYRYALVWCKQFGGAYGVADLGQ